MQTKPESTQQKIPTIESHESSKPKVSVGKKTLNGPNSSRKRLIQLLIATGILSIFLVIIITAKPGDLTVPNVNNGIDPIGLPMSLGATDAKVVINEFSDFQCQACAKFSEKNEKYLIEDYVLKGDVRIIFHPIARLGAESQLASEAAFCAADQRRFWQYKSLLFTYQIGENQGGFSKEKLEKYAAQVSGMNPATFNNCLESHQHYSDVETGPTPASYDSPNNVLTLRINSRILTSTYDYAELQNLIDEVIKHS